MLQFRFQQPRHSTVSLIEKTPFIPIAKIKIRINNAFITFRFIALYYKFAAHRFKNIVYLCAFQTTVIEKYAKSQFRQVHPTHFHGADWLV